ncbi:hypothetical protein BDQ94DRAFT_140133 [Aspergillus welwitschiae]|uniref:Uncharacterized protein n=1 Tax=Aspergillus welwitschiae TaxID=1341132 RepID=A0A3F3Q7A6_9EURO|nr:hypothetical protein BDQ94DRAFT_140133 [Aspergillus welwitschiae]RDH35033.1 hypothetical protein BDQ94DRAFT_140133 [Aspergillus welwitschiae]
MEPRPHSVPGLGSPVPVLEFNCLRPIFGTPLLGFFLGIIMAPMILSRRSWASGRPMPGTAQRAFIETLPGYGRVV